MNKKRVILIGGGFSIKEGLDKDLWSKIKGQEIWSLNYAFKTMPYLPQREIWVDKKFFENNTEDLQNLSKQNVIMVTKHNRRYAEIPKIIQYHTSRIVADYKGKNGIKERKVFIGRMGMVGMFGLSIAICEGYNEIYLLGYDFGIMNPNQPQTHYYQTMIKVKSSGVNRPQVYLTKQGKVKPELEDFKLFTREKDINIYNVSINSNIPYFTKLSWEQFFEKIKEKNN